MKVGRREFLKLIGAAIGSAAVPKGERGKQPEAVEKGKWHHFARSWEGDGTFEGYYLDGTEVTREEFVEATKFDVVIGNPPFQPQEYDCDFYMAIDQGVCHQSWIDPVTGEARRTAIEWFDHGLHTIFRANSQYLGEALSAEVDPFTYAHSIWAAGLAALWQMVTDEGKQWPPTT